MIQNQIGPLPSDRHLVLGGMSLMILNLRLEIIMALTFTSRLEMTLVRALYLTQSLCNLRQRV